MIDDGLLHLDDRCRGDLLHVAAGEHDAGRTGVDELANVEGPARGADVLGAGDVGTVIVAVAPGEASLGGDVKDDVAACRGARDGLGVGDVALDLLEATPRLDALRLAE